MLTRRNFGLATAGLVAAAAGYRSVSSDASEETMATSTDTAFEITKTPEEWRKILTPEQFYVLREHGTERAGSSPLDKNYADGTYECAGCALPLFTSDMKYDSGTGWPSFFTHLPGALGTKLDFWLVVPRTEYHCARCGGHQGHVFDDGPRPTGKRYCNNGVALSFEVAS